jgi:hypothetical protein
MMSELDEMDQALRTQKREVLPLEYAARRAVRSPFDWPGSLRQLLFSLGVASVCYGVVSCTGDHYDVWRDSGILWISLGAGVAAMTIRWPGHVGWKR